MTRLVDTSVVVKWFISEEGQQAAEQLIGTSLIAPDLLLAEVSNVVWKKWRRGEIDIVQTGMAQAMVTSFVEVVPSRPFAEDALSIAIELDHPVYDCYFLAMCVATERAMVTADRRLVDKCARTRFEKFLEPL